MNEIFQEEWKLYRRGVERPQLRGEKPRGSAAFDPDVRPGDIRIFADTNIPLTALVVDDCGLSGRRIVPVSPFSVPASSREMTDGRRVYQLWNATLVSRRLTDRSWLVERIPEDLLAAIRGRIAAAAPGRLTSGDGPQARYEREFLLTGGSLVPLAGRREAPAAERFGGISGWGLAASVALLIGIGATMALWRGTVAGNREYAYDVFATQEYETVQLVEAGDMKQDDALRAEEPSVEFALDASAPKIPNPSEPRQVEGFFSLSRLAAIMSKFPNIFKNSHYGEQYEKEDGVLPLATAKDGAKAGKPKPVEPAPAAVASGTNVLDHARKPLLKSDTSDDIRVDVNFK
ncbi:MAG: hypothetical protein E7049_01015 [Lentisphaerae bacterium]|nr:hypothetical protein [Lentisphaerota bacterium]